MSYELMDYSEARWQPGVPAHVLEDAMVSGRQVIKITWDEDGIPEGVRGNVQWSVRPYRVTDGCDGTRDGCAQAVLMAFGRALGFDPAAVYGRAYPDEGNMYQDEAHIAYLEECLALVELPAFTRASFDHLRASLYDMNFRSLELELEELVEQLEFHSEPEASFETNSGAGLALELG